MAYKDDFEPDENDGSIEQLPDDENLISHTKPSYSSSSSSGTTMTTKALYFGNFLFVLAMGYILYDHIGQKNATDSVAASLSDVAASSADSASLFESKKKMAWDIAQNEAERLLSQATNKETLSCLVADRKKTKKVVKDALEGKYKSSFSTANYKSLEAAHVPLPALNLGMAKVGSTSLFDFFRCAGYTATHFFQGVTSEAPKQPSPPLEGLCMRDAAANGMSPLSTCVQGVDACAQLDAHSAFGWEYKILPYRFISPKLRDDCFFPQLSLLEEIHEEDPNATFLLPFRPIEDWVNSMQSFFDGDLDEFTLCNFPNMPRGIPDLDKPRSEIIEAYEQFVCSHAIHVRNFVEAHPSHALIEYDLYDNEGTADTLGTIFPYVKTSTKADECWGHTAHKGDVHKGDKTVSF